ncbi:MAG: hypothetical protein ACJAVJ_000848 [Planctomycetota bacterium]|jgi:hypothetical protein
MEAKHRSETNAGWTRREARSLAPHTSTGNANQASRRNIGGICLALSDKGWGDQQEGEARVICSGWFDNGAGYASSCSPLARAHAMQAIEATPTTPYAARHMSC